jgi:hypothetical protein
MANQDEHNTSSSSHLSQDISDPFHTVDFRLLFRLSPVDKMNFWILDCHFHSKASYSAEQYMTKSRIQTICYVQCYH